MSLIKYKAILFILFIVFTSCCSTKSYIEDSKIYIIDEYNEPLIGANISIYNLAGILIRRAIINDYISLESGDYIIQVSFIGYKNVSKKLSLDHNEIIIIQLVEENNFNINVI